MTRKAVGYLMCDKEFPEINPELYQIVIKGFEKICEFKKMNLVEIYADLVFEGESQAREADNMWMDIRSKKHGKIDFMIEFIRGFYRIMSPKDMEIIPIETVFSGLPIKGDKISFSRLKQELANQI